MDFSLGLNTALTVGAGALGIRNDPYLAVNFLVEIEGLVVGGFQEVSGLALETETEDYREGGVNEYVHRLAGPTRYPGNLVLRKGLTDIETLWAWHQDVVAGKIERRNGSIYLLDRMRAPAMWWNFTGAYPVKWTGPELRAEQGAVAVEAVELAHRGLAKPALSGALSAVRGVAGAALDVAGGLGGGISF